MSTVPYIFTNNTGNIPLSQLDVNFANVKAFANTAGYVTANAQANITSVGTLSSLSVSGNINTAGNITGGNITGIIVFSTQPYITTVGTLSSLSVTGNVIAGNFAVSNGTFKLPSLTAAQIANIAVANGSMVYNSTQNKIQGYENGAWGNLI